MKKLLKSKMLYAIIGVIMVVIAVNGFFGRIREFNSNIDQYTTSYDIKVEEVEEVEDVYNIDEKHFIEDEPLPIEVAENEIEPIETEVITEASVTTVSIILPVDGDVVEHHSDEELVYNKTMEDWRTHNGIDIAAEVGTAIKAAADGKIVKVGYDGMNGFCVEVEHDGYITKYCGLQESDIVAVDTEVKMGDIIGGVGTTMETEVSDTPHLHFELIKDSKSVNPLEYIENNVL